MTLVVGFTGTRQGPTPAQHKSMDWFLSRLPIGRFLITGKPNTDTMAYNTLRHAYGNILVEWHFALGEPHSSYCNPLSMSFLMPEVSPDERNRTIVSRIDGLVAVPATDVEDIRSGTWATVRYAREIGCPVILILKDGRIVRDG